MCDIKDVARYIGLSLINKGLSVSPLKLQKVLYYVQSWNMVIFGRDKTLFPQAPQAWVNGPVYPEIYYEYKDKVPNMCDHLDANKFLVLIVLISIKLFKNWQRNYRSQKTKLSYLNQYSCCMARNRRMILYF